MLFEMNLLPGRRFALVTLAGIVLARFVPAENLRATRAVLGLGRVTALPLFMINVRQ